MQVIRMESTPPLLPDAYAAELRGFFDCYGNGPEFWNAYQRIMDSATQPGKPVAELLNEMASLAEVMGAVPRAQRV